MRPDLVPTLLAILFEAGLAIAFTGALSGEGGGRGRDCRIMFSNPFAESMSYRPDSFPLCAMGALLGCCAAPLAPGGVGALLCCCAAPFPLLLVGVLRDCCASPLSLGGVGALIECCAAPSPVEEGGTSSPSSPAHVSSVWPP